MILLGWIGSILLACCGIPQALLAFKQKHSDGVSWGMCLMWYIGEWCVLIYMFRSANWPLIFNFIMNIVTISIVIWYKIYPKRSLL
jgi:uncharacterized protein with PQ loop repeat